MAFAIAMPVSYLLVTRWLRNFAYHTDVAPTVRVRNGDVSVTDGPFAETKEQLAGFYLVDARDLNDAIRITSKIPPARVGSIEVRPVRELNVPAEALVAVRRPRNPV